MNKDASIKSYFHKLNINTYLETLYWSEDEMLHELEMRNNSSSNCSISSFTPPDNPPILQS